MLKEYNNAPIQRVVIAVHFEPIPLLNTVNLIGRCFDLMPIFGLDRIEEIQYQDTRIEKEKPTPSTPQLKFMQVPTIGCHLSSKKRDIAIEIQNNRFAITWERESDYPRYKNLKPEFLEKFQQFIRSGNNAVLSPNYTQCGIRYENQVIDNDLSALDNFNFLTLNHFNRYEGIQFSTSQRLCESEEIGRLYLEARTLFAFSENQDGKIEENRYLSVPLTFRGAPKNLSYSGLSPFLDRGHEAIVTTFSQILSDKGKMFFGEKDRA